MRRMSRATASPVGGGARSGPTSNDADRLAALERENRELKRANDILRKASAFFAAAGCPLRELDRLTR